MVTSRTSEIARTLVDIPSHEDLGKIAIAKVAGDLLEARGLDVERGERYLLATHGEGGTLLSGHLDTVPFDATAWDHSQGDLIDGVLHGRGAVDMKGGCAAMIDVACRCVESDVPIRVALTLDEEYGGMHGAKEVARRISEIPPPLTIIGEPTDLVPMMGERGYHYLQVVTRGRTVHSAIHWKGENAIYGMVEVLRSLESYSVGNGPDCDLNVSPNIIEVPNTTKGNMVPEECRLHLDVRFTGDLDMVEVESRVDDIIRRGNGIDFSLERPLENGRPIYSAPARFRMDECLRERVESTVGREFGEAQYTTEASVYSRFFDNLMIWGPGDPLLAHAVNECVRVLDIESYADSLWNLVRSINWK